MDQFDSEINTLTIHRAELVHQAGNQKGCETTRRSARKGFFITGNLGQMDPDRYLRIVGRQKDPIISGGFSIYPKELVVLLDALPGVLESAVIGMPDADFGETTIVILVASAGTSPDPPALLAQITPHLAWFKHPRRIKIVADLPRNTMGKLKRTYCANSSRPPADNGPHPATR
jgi:malonyl-CoA/methylmalonyl-CoA synthetase